MIDHIAYINLEWREEGPLDVASGERFLRQGRKLCTTADYPKYLPCSNPECHDGGFEIGDKITALLATGAESEQNSLICINALLADRGKRCLHTILYSIICIYPYR